VIASGSIADRPVVVVPLPSADAAPARTSDDGAAPVAGPVSGHSFRF
jgi:hypothetical protein